MNYNRLVAIPGSLPAGSVSHTKIVGSFHCNSGNSSSPDLVRIALFVQSRVCWWLPQSRNACGQSVQWGRWSRSWSATGNRLIIAALGVEINEMIGDDPELELDLAHTVAATTVRTGRSRGHTSM